MSRSEADQAVPCVDCGVVDADACSFVIRSDRVLCFGCSLRRGGRWDEERGLWSQEPDMEGLVPMVDPADRQER